MVYIKKTEDTVMRQQSEGNTVITIVLVILS